MQNIPIFREFPGKIKNSWNFKTAEKQISLLKKKKMPSFLSGFIWLARNSKHCTVFRWRDGPDDISRTEKQWGGKRKSSETHHKNPYKIITQRKLENINWLEIKNQKAEIEK